MTDDPLTNGDNKPVTQKELLQLQLRGQEQLYLQMTGLEQKINESFQRLDLSVLGMVERIARIEGAQVNAAQRQNWSIGIRQQHVVALGIVASFIMSILSMTHPF